MAGEASVKFAAGLVDKKMVAVVGSTSTDRILHKAMATAFHKVHIAARHEAKLHKRAPKNKNAAKKGKSHNTKKRSSKKHAAKGKGKTTTKKHDSKKHATKGKAKTTKAKKSSHKKKEAPKKKKASKKNNKKNEKKTKKTKGKKQGKKLLLTQLSAATRQKMMAYIAARSKVAGATQKK